VRLYIAGQWVPLDNGGYCYDGSGGGRRVELGLGIVAGAQAGAGAEAGADAHGAATASEEGEEDDNAADAAANIAMVASAAEELGDGEAHPVQWKQIKTWFENRRMTQKRIREGTIPVRRPSSTSHKAAAPPPSRHSPKQQQSRKLKQEHEPEPELKRKRACKMSRPLSKRQMTQMSPRASPVGLLGGRGGEGGGALGSSRSGDGGGGDYSGGRGSVSGETERERIVSSSAALKHGVKRSRRGRSPILSSGLKSGYSTDKQVGEAGKAGEADGAGETAAAMMMTAAAAATTAAARNECWGEQSALTRAISWVSFHEALDTTNAGAGA